MCKYEGRKAERLTTSMSEEDDRYADWLKDIKRLSGMPVKNEPKPEEYRAPETPDTPAAEG